MDYTFSDVIFLSGCCFYCYFIIYMFHFIDIRQLDQLTMPKLLGYITLMVRCIYSFTQLDKKIEQVKDSLIRDN